MTTSMRRDVPSTGAALATLAQVTLRRLIRSRAPWIGLAIAALPVMFAGVLGQRHGAGSMTALFAIQTLVLAVLPPMFVASSIGEDLEDRTNTYLWSRPLARWTLLVGKLIAVVPIVVVLVAGSWLVAANLLFHSFEPRPALGLATCAVAVSLISAGLATLVPRHGMALTICYLLFFDLPVGEIPASLQILSVTHQAKLITESPSLQPFLVTATIAGVWLAIGLWRIRRLEA